MRGTYKFWIDERITYGDGEICHRSFEYDVERGWHLFEQWSAPYMTEDEYYARQYDCYVDVDEVPELTDPGVTWGVRRNRKHKES